MMGKYRLLIVVCDPKRAVFGLQDGLSCRDARQSVEIAFKTLLWSFVDERQ